LVDYKWIVLSNTSLAIVMSSLDANIVQIALPTIGKKLAGTTTFDLLWILVGYQLIITAFLVNFGRLGDMFGRVKLYNLGFAVFTLASGLCSLSQTGDELAAFRMLQGLGGALVIANSAALITDAFPVNERGRALGTNQMMLIVGSVGGLVLGGFLTTELGWQSIFWVNLPIGTFATLWAHFKLRELSKRERGQKIDVKGNVSFASGIFLFLIGISLFASGGYPASLDAALSVAGVAALVVFVYIERMVKSPMVRLSLFRIRAFTGGALASGMNALARGAITLVLVFYLQSPLIGLSPLAAGVYLIPNSASIALMGPISGWLSDRYDPRIFTTGGLIVSSIGLALLTQIGSTVNFWQLTPSLVLIGAGFGIFASPNRSSVMSSVPPEHRGVASGITSTTLQFGMSLSRALAFVIMGSVLPVGDIARLFAGTLVLNTPAADQVFLNSVRLVFEVSTVLLLISIIPSILRGKRSVYVERSGPSLGGEPEAPA
jgi:EmrB/QacA subfamily drug resistance transporter